MPYDTKMSHVVDYVVKNCARLLGHLDTKDFDMVSFVKVTDRTYSAAMDKLNQAEQYAQSKFDIGMKNQYSTNSRHTESAPYVLGSIQILKNAVRIDYNTLNSTVSSNSDFVTTPMEIRIINNTGYAMAVMTGDDYKKIVEITKREPEWDMSGGTADVVSCCLSSYDRWMCRPYYNRGYFSDEFRISNVPYKKLQSELKVLRQEYYSVRDNPPELEEEFCSADQTTAKWHKKLQTAFDAVVDKERALKWYCPFEN